MASSRSEAHKLAVLGLEPHVDGLIVSETIGFQKPAREFFEYAMARTRVERSACVVVGDLWDVDIKGALDAGFERRQCCGAGLFA